MASPDRIKISEEYYIGKGLWLAVECPIVPGEDPVQEFLKARAILSEAFKAISSDYADVPGHPQAVRQVDISEPKIGMEEAINGCTDLEVLSSFKLLVKGNSEYQAAYDKKFAELSK